MDFRKELVKVLKKHVKKVDELLSVPPNAKMGDYALPCFTLGKDAHQAAEKLKDKLKLPKFVSKTEVMGPYLNFFLNKVIFAESVLTSVNKEGKEYGSSKIGKNKIIAIDYSHPNIAKPFSVGHLRSTVIGNSLYRTLAFVGYKPISCNHLGDWGTQFGKLIVAYKKWGNKKELEKEPIKHLLKLYVKFHDKESEKLADEARAAFKSLEDGNQEYLELWQAFKDLSLKEFQRIYSILNVMFDSYNGEAFMNTRIDAAIKKFQKKVRTEISDGALIVDLEKYNMAPVLVRKSDGATTYHTRDIAAIFYRFNELKADKLVYVVGQEQKLHFRQLFKTMELYGYDKDKFLHADFGHFRLPEGKMSTRKGRVIFLEDVLTKSIDLAEKVIKEKNPKLKNRKEVAKQVGVGAIIFGDLIHDRVKDIEFDRKRILSFDGETAPYVQYTHARACSILRKAGKLGKVSFEHFTHPEELALITLLDQFPSILIKVSETYKPHHLAHYLIELAQSFNEFYHKCPVISEVKSQMNARLLLVDSVRQVLENGLGLLGIESPKEM